MNAMHPTTKQQSTLVSADTICAPATTPGGALGIIRIAGQQSIGILSQIFSKNLVDAKANTLHHGLITDEKGETIDEVVVSIFRAPHSYTGEDAVEITCHGSRFIIGKVLELLVRKGCRMANPGEFTQRAYLNGKLDLSQAEAVADLIASTNQATHRMAMSQLRGGISTELATLRERLLHLTTLLELELDFSDHEDLEFADRSELFKLAQTIDAHITHLAQSFELGQALKQGIPVAIVGKTNVGKSTLLNRLLRDDRAIVSDIHGTTRDTIEDVMVINGVQFRFIDTAGIRQTTDVVEQIGIDRTYQAISKARIVLWIIDQETTPEELKEIQEKNEGKSLLIIINKIDKHQDVESIANHVSEAGIEHIGISAKKGINIEALEQKILTLANIPEIKENDVIITSARHYQALLNAHENLQRVIDSLNLSLSGDLIAEDLKSVLDDLSEITGEGRITPQETLNNIFSQFCVGK